MFQIKIDTEILIKLREKINDEVNISYNKEYYYVVDKKERKQKSFVLGIKYAQLWID
ncbi:hypothetical protein ACV3ON_02950 [Clostridium perfringens]|uniref:hypothetical protein n=1 Tax=Clostridium perfringens TaxID=1502 RepID=UPI0019D2BE24|nr:hypothetical protein [Clostridium perfringens]MDK0830086.1 hypothetical protein [Clostridium perfringens]MDM0622162.1 hypothetical protein [Clostridium perfringens]